MSSSYLYECFVLFTIEIPYVFLLFVSLTVLQIELYILYYVPRLGAFAPRVGPFILENKIKKNKKNTRKKGKQKK